MYSFFTHRNAVLLLTLLCLACTPSSEVPDEVIAVVDDTRLTLDDLEKSQLLSPQYAIRTPLREARRSQLGYLIDEQHILMTAEAADIENEPQIQRRIGYIHDRETLKAFIRRKFLDSLQISDVEMLRGAARFNRRLKVRQIYAKTAQAAREIQTELRKGTDFEILFQRTHPDTVDATGYVTFGDLAPPLENAAYSSGIGEVSGPIQTRSGYHFLEVLDVREDANNTALAQNIRNDRIRQVIGNRKADARIRAYLTSLAGGRQIRLNNRNLETLTREINQAMGDKYEQPSIFVPSINNRELRAIDERLTSSLNATLALFGDTPFTVADLMMRVREMPPLQRPYLRTLQQVGQFVIDEIRRDLLMKEAVTSGINREPQVREAIRENIDALLINEVRGRLYSRGYADANPAEKARLDSLLGEIREEYPARIYKEHLFSDGARPDSLLPPPIHLFVKNKYIW